MLRELSDGMYRPITYLTAKITEELIMAAFSSLFFCCLTFFALELPGSFLLYFLVYYLTTCIGIGASCLCTNLQAQHPGHHHATFQGG